MFTPAPLPDLRTRFKLLPAGEDFHVMACKRHSSNDPSGIIRVTYTIKRNRTPLFTGSHEACTAYVTGINGIIID